ncbi:ATP-binding protein [Emcibacteraceae bacterium]|nr:ATP-binding protein [Emcibacteraceae bacterium]
MKRAIRSFNTMQKVVSNHIEQRITALTALSHDIRTPLTSLRIKAELIDESSLKDGIISSVEKMENLTSSVIDFLKGSDTLIQKKQTDLKKLIETECIERQELGNPVIINALDDIIVNCDPDAINRALQNLIDNALKYGKSATISLSHDDDMADIIVEDNGEGIDKKQLSKVLEPFERVGKERNSEKGGFGLGLSIVNDIAKAHNGSIQLKNKIGGGIRASLKIALK